MYRILLLILFAVGMFLSPLVHAKSAQNLMKLRTAIYISGPLSEEKGILYIAGLEYRFTDTNSKFEEVFADLALGYRLAENVIGWAGVRGLVTVNSRSDPSTFTQNHPFQQITWVMINKPGFKVGSRTRLEQRYISGDANWRVRLRQRFTAEFTRMIVDRYTPMLYNETHFNIGQAGYAIPETRTFLGVSIPMTKRRNTFEIGYLNQFIKSTAPTNIITHALYTTVRISTG